MRNREGRLLLLCFLVIAASSRSAAGQGVSFGAPQETLPNPRLLPPAVAPCPPAKVAAEAPPQPSPEVRKQFAEFVQGTVDPQNTLDVILGRPRLLVLKQTPKRVQIESDEKNPVATTTLITDREVSIAGKRVGTAVLNLWFPEPQDPTKLRILSYLVRVIPDFQAREQAREWQQRYYKALQDEINHAFPDSLICLQLVANNLVVSGQALDGAQAEQILRIVAYNAPRGFKEEAPLAPGQLTLTSGTTDINLTGTNTQQSAVTTPGLEPALAEAKGLVGTGQRLGAGLGTAGLNIINQIRVPGEQQVMLRVTVAEVDRGAARSIGIDFSISNKQGMIVFAQNTGNFLMATGMTGTLSTAANLPLLLDNGRIPVAINALRSINLARTLAEPNLTTLNGQTARFQAGGEFAVPVVTGFTAAGLQGVQFVPFGVQLRFTPTVTDKDRIRLIVNADVSTLDLNNSATVGTTNVPGLNTRNFETTVELREGQTLAVAGLLQTSYNANAVRVPLFGDLPVIGNFFRLQQNGSSEQELVILVTPELVHPLDHAERKPPLPGDDVFEPGDLEFYLLGRLESRREYDYRTSVRTDLMRMLRYRHCEDVFILGPQGHSDGKAPAAPGVSH